MNEASQPNLMRHKKLQNRSRCNKSDGAHGPYGDEPPEPTQRTAGGFLPPTGNDGVSDTHRLL